LQIDEELTKLYPWLGWHSFLTHGVDTGSAKLNQKGKYLGQRSCSC